MLFARNVSGTRVVAQGEVKEVGGYTFIGFGAHHNTYPCTYLTVAAAIGMTTEDVDSLIKRLSKVLDKWKSKFKPRKSSQGDKASSNGNSIIVNSEGDNKGCEKSKK